MKADEKKKSAEKLAKEISKDFYVSEEAKNHDYADYVRVTSTPHGMILSFGKWRIDKLKFGLYKDILLPYDVANSLSGVITDQIEKLTEQGLIERRSSKEEEDK